MEKRINIINFSDLKNALSLDNNQAFGEKYYYNKDFPYDTTPSYRRENLYQQQSIALNEGCSYVDTVKQEHSIVVKCPIGTSISYTLLDA